MTDPFNFGRLPQDPLLDEIRSQHRVILALGVSMIVLGTLAILFPLIATRVTGLVLGWILLFAGTVQAMHSFRVWHWRGFLVQTLAAVLTLVVGAFLLLFPSLSIATLTLLIGAYLVIAGAFRLALALLVRPMPGWAWILTGGVASLLLGTLAIAQWQAAAIWLLGILVGVDLLFIGWSLVGLAAAAGRLRR